MISYVCVQFTTCIHNDNCSVITIHCCAMFNKNDESLHNPQYVQNLIINN